MKLRLFILLSFNILIFSGYSQKNYWNTIQESQIKPNDSELIDHDFTLKTKKFFQLDRQSLEETLAGSPMRSANSSEVVIEVPNHLGDFEQFEIYKTNTMAPELANRFESIKSYIGKSVDRKSGSILRLTVAPQGIYIMILNPSLGQIFINPYDKNANYYFSFTKSSALDLTENACLFSSENSQGSEEILLDKSLKSTNLSIDDSTLRTYDLALAVTGEYSQFQISQAGLDGGTNNQKVAAVLGAMVVSIDRVNSIYERDIGVSLQLIADTDQLIYLNGVTDPYTNFNGGAMLSENQSNVTSVIGSNNFNVGHVFSTGGGGVAILGSVCVSSQKARGVTGSPAPVGDPFDVDFVAHELGHQFGANHTQNNPCQRNASTAVEPGSASTIMGYAGICPPNVQTNSDAFFHQISLIEINNNLTNGAASTCGDFTASSNTAPNVIQVSDHTIPNGTAFYLDVTATDSQNDVLTYSWEQIDNEISIQHPPLASFTQGPNFRSLPASLNSRRYFPNFDNILSNNLTPTWEVIPNVARQMEFVVTVRDNNQLLGQTSSSFSDVNFASVGPFEVTSQNTNGINWQPGNTENITWNVAGTTANGINTSNVNILLSTDNGQNFDTILASNTANDGNQNITVPDVQAAFCRIMIEPVDNVYFALNQSTFAIDTEVTNECDFYENTTLVNIPDSPGSNQQGQAVQSIINIPNNITQYDDVTINLDVSHTFISDLVFQLDNPNGDTAVLWGRNCGGENSFNLDFNDSGSSLPFQTSCSNPFQGIYVPADGTTLNDFFSNGTQGDWILTFADFAPGDTGTLNSWSIEVCSTNLSTIDINSNNFDILPNPSRGNFNINLSNQLTEDGLIKIYDISGKLIESFSINMGLKTRSLQLNAQSGIYLVELTSEGSKIIKKLILK